MTGRELQRWRFQRGVERSELARILDVSERTVMRYEACGADEIPMMATLAVQAVEQDLARHLLPLRT